MNLLRSRYQGQCICSVEFSFIHKIIITCAFKYNLMLHICTEIGTIFCGLVNNVRGNSENILVFKVTLLHLQATLLM